MEQEVGWVRLPFVGRFVGGGGQSCWGGVGMARLWGLLEGFCGEAEAHCVINCGKGDLDSE